MAIEVGEDLLRAIANKEKTISDGRSLARKGAFKNTKKTADGTLLWGECQGSALYVLSVDLAGDKPITRCTCPVKPPPCKHALGFLVYFLEQPAKFAQTEPPAELVEKREKAAGRAEKRAESAAKPREVNKAALAKKTGAQRDALDTLEKLVLDVASAGLGTLDAKKSGRLVEQAKQMTDAYLPGAAVALRRLASLADGRTRDDDDPADFDDSPEAALSDDDRRLLMTRHLTRLWAMVRRGQKRLDEKLEEGESQSDADAVVEDLLGRVWRLEELKERNHVRRDLQLLELAYERYDDAARDERVEQSFLVELGDGSVYADRTFRPLAALGKTKEKESYESLLTVSEAAVYPGFVNRRMRWEIGAVRRRDAKPEDWQKLHALALPTIEAAIAKYKEQIKNPLAPDDAVLLVRVKDFLRTRTGTAAADDKGARLLLGDPPTAHYRFAPNLESAAGAAWGGKSGQPLALLVRLWPGPSDNGIRGQPLALVAGGRHVRLGM